MPLPIAITFAVVGGIASLAAMVLIATVIFAKPKTGSDFHRDKAFLAFILLVIGLPALGLSAYNSDPWKVWVGLGLALLMGSSLILGRATLHNGTEEKLIPKDSQG